MERLIAGLILFVAVHSIPLKAELRTKVVARMGEGAYKGIFSLLSLLGFYFIVTGKSSAPVVAVWQPAAWSAWATIVLMFVAIILVVAAYFPSNVKRYTAHPMLWGVSIWAVAHLLSNGDLASMILFAGFGLYAIIGLIAERKKSSAADTSISDSTVSARWTSDFLLVALGTVVYATIIFFHMSMFGKPVLA